MEGGEDGEPHDWWSYARATLALEGGDEQGGDDGGSGGAGGAGGAAAATHQRPSPVVRSPSKGTVADAVTAQLVIVNALGSLAA